MRKTVLAVLMALVALCVSAMAEETAEEWVKKGDELFAAGSIDEALQAWDKALQIYNEIIEQNPQDVKVLIEKVELLDRKAELKNGDARKETLHIIDKALELDSNSSESWYHKGKSLYYLGITGYPIQERETVFVDAVKAFDKAIEIDPINFQVWFERGFVVLQWGSLDEWMGKHDESQNKWEESLKSCDKAIEILNQTAKTDLKNFEGLLWWMKGFNLYQLGQYTEALHACNKAIELDFMGGWDVKARTLSELGMHNESLDAFNNSQYPLSITRKGMLLLALGNNDMALDTFNQAVEVSPDYVKAWEGKGTALARLGRHEDSAKAYEKALARHDENIRQHPKDAKVWTDRGDFLYKIGMYDVAIDSFDKAIDIYPEFSPAWQGKGDALKAIGRNLEADMAFTKARELGYNVSLKNLLYGPTL